MYVPWKPLARFLQITRSSSRSRRSSIAASHEPSSRTSTGILLCQRPMSLHSPRVVFLYAVVVCTTGTFLARAASSKRSVAGMIVSM